MNQFEIYLVLLFFNLIIGSQFEMISVMKNAKLNLLSFITILSFFQTFFNSSIGWSDFVDCDRVAMKEESSIEDIMAVCDAPILSRRGCTINIEKACINGYEVDFLAVIAGTLESATAFKANDSRYVHGVTSSDFLDSKTHPKDLYKEVKIGERTQALCLKANGVKISDIDANHAFNTYQLDSMGEKFVLESVPSFIKPDFFSSDRSLHWKVTKKQDEFTVELEIRSLDEVDKSVKIYKDSNRLFTATGRGATLDQAIENAVDAFSTESKVVRCIQKNASGPIYFSSLKQYDPESKGIYIKNHKKLMNQLSTTLGNTDQLTQNFQDNLGNIKMAEADPQQDTPPAPVTSRSTSIPKLNSNTKQQRGVRHP